MSTSSPFHGWADPGSSGCWPWPSWPSSFGISIGVAVTGPIVASTGPGFISSSRVAWALLGGCGLAVLALGIVSTSGWAKAAAARNGQRLAGAPAPGAQEHPRQPQP